MFHIMIDIILMGTHVRLAIPVFILLNIENNKNRRRLRCLTKGKLCRRHKSKINPLF